MNYRRGNETDVTYDEIVFSFSHHDFYGFYYNLTIFDHNIDKIQL